MAELPIKEIMIIGPDFYVDGALKSLMNKEGVLCIGDGANDVTLELIKEKLQKVALADNILRVDICAHGMLDNQKQQNIILESSSLTKTEDFLKEMKNLLIKQSGKQELKAEWHLWSCFGGSANKITSILGKENTLITHIDSNNISATYLEDYSIKKSVGNYLKNSEKDAYSRWVEEQKYSFQSSTFNFNSTSDPNDSVHLKTSRTFKPEILKDIVKRFKYTDDLTVIFTDFIAEDIRKIESSKEFRELKEQGYFKANFKESDAVKIELNEEEAKNLVLGIAIYLCDKIREQDIGVFKEYLSVIKQSGIDLDSDALGDTILMRASGENKDEIVELLIKEYEVNASKSDGEGRTALFIAAGKGNLKVVETFIRNNIHINQPNNLSRTPLWIASQNGHTEVVRDLLEHGADPKDDDYYSMTPLWIAAQNGHTEIVRDLLEYGADPNKADNRDITPLLMPSYDGHISVVEELLKYGANADLNSIKYLKKTNINIDMPAKDGSTMLLRAIKNEQSDIVKVLLETGANSKDGTTPLQAAMSTKNQHIVQLITSYAQKVQNKQQCQQRINI
ncbi:MAG TPA: ankyrin repeat domain-containing protein [Rickettsia endosymbiont of Omalisus fontisbellaquei]|nr:ankyrin repeat domain-containing protein [Rickettsia endosymbiont of Omalisus fontisbellaquei]